MEAQNRKVHTEIWNALLDGWNNSSSQTCAYWQMKRIEPILDSLVFALQEAAKALEAAGFTHSADKAWEAAR